MTKTTKPTPSWRDVLPIHPAAELFPRMSPDELRALGEDIVKNKLRTPLALWKEQKHFPPVLLDGRSRADALERVGCEIDVERCGTDGDFQIELSYRRIGTSMWFPIDTIALRGDKGDDPYAYVVSANIHRRHLTAEKKRELIADLIKATPEKSDRQIAETVKASHHTVGTVRAEMEGRGQIAHLETRTDAAGRKQPSSKQLRQQPAKPSTGLLKWTIDSNQATAAGPVDLDAFAIEGAIYTVTGSKELRKGQPKFFTVDLLTDVGHQSIGTKRTLPAAQGFCEDHFRAWRRQAAIPRGTESANDTAPVGTAEPRDIGPTSTGEITRKDAEIEQLRNEKRRLEIRIERLCSEVDEAKAAAKPDGEPLTLLVQLLSEIIGDVQDAAWIAPR